VGEQRERPVELVVAVLTFRRPEELIEGIPLVLAHARSASLETGRALRARVLVVDNDPAASASPVVERLRDSHSDGVALDYVVENTPGIAAARNRAMDESTGADLLAFIDDDERPRDDWLAALLCTWTASHAAAVMGRVISEFDGELDDWVAAGDFFRRRSMPTGTVIRVAAAGNLLLDLRQVRALGVRFEEELGLGAGEDSLFSRELVRRGGRIVWCEESAATDCVPRERMTRRWVLARAWSHGNTESVVDLYLADGAIPRAVAKAKALARGVVRIAAGSARYLLGVASGSLRHQARGLRTAYRGAGIAAGGAGVVVHEYSRET
jgi:succinoglycan biosynthesis protein ExoM